MLDTESIYFLLAGVGVYFLIIMFTIMCSPLSRDAPSDEEESSVRTIYKLRSRDVTGVHHS